jgi:hypothetical protein
MTLHPEERGVCARCFNLWPRTSDYWPKVPRSIDGLGTWCKACASEQGRIYAAKARARAR